MIKTVFASMLMNTVGISVKMDTAQTATASTSSTSTINVRLKTAIAGLILEEDALSAEMATMSIVGYATLIPKDVPPRRISSNVWNVNQDIKWMVVDPASLKSPFCPGTHLIWTSSADSLISRLIKANKSSQLAKLIN